MTVSISISFMFRCKTLIPAHPLSYHARTNECFKYRVEPVKYSNDLEDSTDRNGTSAITTGDHSHNPCNSPKNLYQEHTHFWSFELYLQHGPLIPPPPPAQKSLRIRQWEPVPFALEWVFPSVNEILRFFITNESDFFFEYFKFEHF